MMCSTFRRPTLLACGYSPPRKSPLRRARLFGVEERFERGKCRTIFLSHRLLQLSLLRHVDGRPRHGRLESSLDECKSALGFNVEESCRSKHHQISTQGTFLVTEDRVRRIEERSRPRSTRVSLSTGVRNGHASPDRNGSVRDRTESIEQNSCAVIGNAENIWHAVSSLRSRKYRQRKARPQRNHRGKVN